MLAYQKSFQLALDIQIITKKITYSEKYALVDQIRRSSRSVCANFAEAYCRRKSVKHFISKLNDAQSESCETQVWLEFAFAFAYINEEEYKLLTEQNNEIGKLLTYMILNPGKFI